MFKLLNINVDTSAGLNHINPRVSYELRNEIVSPVKLRFEQSVQEKCKCKIDIDVQNVTNESDAQKRLPNDWRSGNISAIYKKGSKLDASNYRPISLTCICCKSSLEFIMRVQFFISNGVLSKGNEILGLIKWTVISKEKNVILNLYKEGYNRYKK